MKLLAFFFLLLSTISFSQTIDLPNLRSQAERMSNSVITEKWDTLANHTYPKVVQLLGGRENLIAAVKEGMETMKANGYVFESVTLGEPSKVVQAGDELHCIIPQSTVLIVPGGKSKIKTRGYLIAISQNQGRHWYFLDGNKFDNDNIKGFLPNFNSELKLPKKEKPETIRN